MSHLLQALSLKIISKGVLIMGFTKKEIIALLQEWSCEEEERANNAVTEFFRGFAAGRASAYRAVIHLINAIKTK